MAKKPPTGGDDKDKIVDLKIAVTGHNKIRKKINALSGVSAALMSKQHLQRLMLERTLERFDKEVDPAGNRWAPLSEQTIYRRMYTGGHPNKTLYQFGTLRNSIGVTSKRGLASATNLGFRIGIDSSDPRIIGIARLQNFGGYTWEGRRVPARRFLGIGRDDQRAAEGLMDQLATSALRS